MVPVEKCFVGFIQGFLYVGSAVIAQLFDNGLIERGEYSKFFYGVYHDLTHLLITVFGNDFWNHTGPDYFVNEIQRKLL